MPQLIVFFPFLKPNVSQLRMPTALESFTWWDCSYYLRVGYVRAQCKKTEKLIKFKMFCWLRLSQVLWPNLTRQVIVQMPMRLPIQSNPHFSFDRDVQHFLECVQGPSFRVFFLSLEEGGV